jgi:hypothetical protein
MSAPAPVRMEGGRRAAVSSGAGRGCFTRPRPILISQEARHA